MNWRSGGVTERRITHRPGGKRERRHHGETDQHHAAEFAQAAAQNGAELAGQSGHAVEAAVDHRHRVRPIRSFPRKRKSSLTCFFATKRSLLSRGRTEVNSIVSTGACANPAPPPGDASPRR